MSEFTTIYEILMLLMIGGLLGLKIYELKKRFTLPKYSPPPQLPIPPVTPFATTLSGVNH